MERYSVLLNVAYKRYSEKTEYVGLQTLSLFYELFENISACDNNSLFVQEWICYSRIYWKALGINKVVKIIRYQ